jgi:hypothetical protein
MSTVSSLLLKALMPLSVLFLISTSAFAQFSAQWPPGSGANYSIATDGTWTFLNAPSTDGGFEFRHGNLTGPPLMSIASDGHILVYNSIDISNVFINPALRATTAAGFPAAGIYGISTAPSNGVGTRGEASGASSIGVFGQADLAGVQGFSTATNGFGTSGVASGAGGHAIDAICNGSCPASGGLAGNFQGDVVIRGQNGLTLTAGSIITPALRATTGSVVAPTLQTTPGGVVNVQDGGDNTTIQLDGGSGRIATRVLQITGGGDLDEAFEVRGAIKPGMLVAIDPVHPGQLRISDKAYDRTIAGIISGANGINPGLIMQQQRTVADGSSPVALTGRVYCWADASNGPINPGNLLTASNTPGHAMKVTNYAKAYGAVIGKAMTKLKQGKGLVLVLIALQ